MDATGIAILERLEAVVTSLQENSIKMGQLLAVHQEKLEQQEKTDDVLFSKIDHLHKDLHQKTDEIKTAAHLKSYLAQKIGLAVIHGSVFRQPDFIRFSYANTPAYVQGALERLEYGVQRLR